MVSPSFHDESLLACWAASARHLALPGKQQFILTLSSGVTWVPSNHSLRVLDIIAAKNGFERPGSVAEMIMPSVCENAFLTPAQAVDRGLALLGRTRQRGPHFSGWQHTYFERMVGEWQNRNGMRSRFRSNKLIETIEKLNRWGRNAESACYIHIPLDSENFRTRGGPCLQYVQFRAFGDHLLDVIGVYRAHDYDNKALGNLVGLNRLGRFVAGHTGRLLNGTSVVSLHPFTNHKARLKKFADDVSP